jgi:hypothetical protein
VPPRWSPTGAFCGWRDRRSTARFRAKVGVQPVRIGRSRRGTVERAERRVTARLPSSAPAEQIGPGRPRQTHLRRTVSGIPLGSEGRRRTGRWTVRHASKSGSGMPSRCATALGGTSPRCGRAGSGARNRLTACYAAGSVEAWFRICFRRLHQARSVRRNACSMCGINAAVSTGS